MSLPARVALAVLLVGLSAAALLSEPCPPGTIFEVTAYSRSGAILERGNGICVGEGLLLMPYHVAEGAVRVEATHGNAVVTKGDTFFALDEASDLAIVRIEGEEPLPVPFPLSLGEIRVNDLVVNHANRLGEASTYQTWVESVLRPEGRQPLLAVGRGYRDWTSGSPLCEEGGGLAGMIIHASGSGFTEPSLTYAVDPRKMIRNPGAWRSAALASVAAEYFGEDCPDSILLARKCLGTRSLGELRQLLEHVPRDHRDLPVFRELRGYSHSAAGRFDEATGDLRHARRSGGISWWARDLLGDLLSRDERWLEAEVVYQEALELRQVHPSNTHGWITDPWFGIAKVWEARGNPDEARRARERGRRLTPER